MKMLVAGIKRVSGDKGSKSGLPFDFTELFGLTLIDPVNNDKVHVEGFGYEPAKLPVSDGALGAFKPYEGKFPCLLDLDTDVEPFMGRFETVVVGVRPAPAPAAKAA